MTTPNVVLYMIENARLEEQLVAAKNTADLETTIVGILCMIIGLLFGVFIAYMYNRD